MTVLVDWRCKMKLPYTNKSVNVLPQTASQTGRSFVRAQGSAQCRLLCAVLMTKNEQPVRSWRQFESGVKLVQRTKAQEITLPRI